MTSFFIRVNGQATAGGPGRYMRVTVDRSFEATGDDWCPVDVRDHDTRMESQAIILASTAADPRALLAEGQMRDCIRSVWSNSTRPPGGIFGERLPDDFTVELQHPANWETIPAGPRED